MEINTQTNRDYRYERKYFVDLLDARQAIALVKRHPALFSEIYPPRYINNIYFDSPLLGSYCDNVDGDPERKKTRIRWYNELFCQVEEPILEIKIKKGLMGTKIQIPFPAFYFGEGFSKRAMFDMIISSNLPADIIDYLKATEPVLVNRYLRWYFATPDRHFRITIDTSLSFFHLKKDNNRFLFHRADHQSIVVELKYRREYDPEASRISSGFPFRMTRSSKYIQGIERVYI
jgi:SPX domain protein involved in polyphosphate accumulation